MIPATQIRSIVSPRQATEEIEVSTELKALRERIESLPGEWSRDLQPLLDEVCEDARFRGRVLTLARSALENLHLELSSARFDLEVTRRERDALRSNFP